jgi:hypothetical protein
MLEIGKPGSAGTERDVIGGQSWVVTRRGRTTVGRWTSEPDEAARLRARQPSWWKSSWLLDLEGTFMLWLELVLRRRAATAAAA